MWNNIAILKSGVIIFTLKKIEFQMETSDHMIGIFWKKNNIKIVKV